MDVRLPAASRRSTDKVPAIIRVQASPFIRPSIHPPIARSHMAMTRENHPIENETEGERERRLTRGSTDGGRRFSLGQKWWRGQASLRRSPCSERYDGRRRAMRGVSLRVFCRGSGRRSCGFVECECKCEWGQQRGRENQPREHGSLFFMLIDGRGQLRQQPIADAPALSDAVLPAYSGNEGWRSGHCCDRRLPALPTLILPPAQA